jgi:hypothetical protein
LSETLVSLDEGFVDRLLLFYNFLFHLFSLTFLFIIFSDATTEVGSFHSTGRVAGRLGPEHRLGELFKWRYGKSSVNHGVTNPIPVGVTSVDNLADFAPAVKNQVRSMTIRLILLRPSKIQYPALIIRPIPLLSSKIRPILSRFCSCRSTGGF